MAGAIGTNGTRDEAAAAWKMEGRVRAGQPRGRRLATLAATLVVECGWFMAAMP